MAISPAGGPVPPPEFTPIQPQLNSGLPQLFSGALRGLVVLQSGLPISAQELTEIAQGNTGTQSMIINSTFMLPPTEPHAPPPPRALTPQPSSRIASPLPQFPPNAEIRITPVPSPVLSSAPVRRPPHSRGQSSSNRNELGVGLRVGTGLNGEDPLELGIRINLERTVRPVRYMGSVLAVCGATYLGLSLETNNLRTHPLLTALSVIAVALGLFTLIITQPQHRPHSGPELPV